MDAIREGKSAAAQARREAADVRSASLKHHVLRAGFGGRVRRSGWLKTGRADIVVQHIYSVCTAAEEEKGALPADAPALAASRARKLSLPRGIWEQQPGYRPHCFPSSATPNLGRFPTAKGVPGMPPSSLCPRNGKKKGTSPRPEGRAGTTTEGKGDSGGTRT